MFTDGRLEFYTHEQSESFATASPFGANVDTSVKGEVFYRETNNRAVLEKALSVIQLTFPDISSFAPASAFIATWFFVGYHRAHDDQVSMNSATA